MAIYTNTEGIVVTEEITAWSVKTTYVWFSIDSWSNTRSLATLKTLPIWQITKYIETTSGGTKTTDMYQATKSQYTGINVRTNEPLFIWNDRATLTYL